MDGMGGRQDPITKFSKLKNLLRREKAGHKFDRTNAIKRIWKWGKKAGRQGREKN